MGYFCSEVSIDCQFTSEWNIVGVEFTGKMIFNGHVMEVISDVSTRVFIVLMTIDWIR